MGNIRTYIPKKKRHLAEQLATKKYLTLLLEDLLQEQNAITLYLEHHNKKFGKAENLLHRMPEYSKLLSGFYKPMSQKLLEWSNPTYERNTKYPEQLIYKSLSGNLVRSKSEAIIDMFLYMNKIPYRYECSLQLGDTIIYPDFTIRHPQTGKLFYWEHFGYIYYILFHLYPNTVFSGPCTYISYTYI